MTCFAELIGVQVATGRSASAELTASASGIPTTVLIVIVVIRAEALEDVIVRERVIPESEGIRFENGHWPSYWCLLYVGFCAQFSRVFISA